MRLGSLTAKFICLSSAFVILLGLFIYTGFRFTHHIKDEATRINLAGQLRFRSFEIAWHINNLVNELVKRNPEEWIYHRTEIEDNINAFDDLIKVLREGRVGNEIKPLRDREILQKFEDLSYCWQKELKPVILKGLSLPKDFHEREARKLLKPFNNRVDNFVYEVDSFVKLLEDNYRKKIRNFNRFRLIVLCFFAIAGVFSVLYLRRSILKPIWRLKEAAEEFGKGNLTLRVSYKGEDEISVLTKSFNEMADSIKNLILETKTQSDQILSLFNASNSLTGIKRLEDLYKAICENALKILDIKFIWLGIKTEKFEVIPVAWAGTDDDYLREIKVRWDDSLEGMGLLVWL